ncbi:MAG: precorrin-6y C5,15-methyltransferase (decarboxylating) subunit CbiE [Nitrospirae bacterium]|nr:precorrin-6y C5,15-methyltransferase (decarboxylating) subunit CbiE [Candidatus Manganitrophaceae bacterium]
MGEPFKEKVQVVGVGEDGILSMSLKAMRLIQDAEILFGSERLLALFPNHDAKKILLQADLKEAVGIIRSNLGRRQMAVLAPGDPNFFGIGPELIAQLGKDGVEIFPNVSTMQLAFARIKEGWGDAYLGSVRNRPIEAIVEPVRAASKAGLLTDDRHTPAAVAQLLLQHGIEERRVYLFEEIGGGEERLTKTNLTHLIGKTFSPAGVMILLKGP